MKLFATVLLVCISLALVAQPGNDECNTAINLGTAPFCEDTYFTNVDATASLVVPNNQPPCWDNNTVQRDVWFSFVASDTILDYDISILGESDPGGSNPMVNPQVALYRGSCGPNNLFFLDCFKSAFGSNSLKFQVSGLTPGSTYYLRIADYPEPVTNNAGTFKLCIEKKSPFTNITQGFSSECEGTLVDSGGPDENYGPNEDHTFTICPGLPTQCLELVFTYYHLDFNTDIITIYDGADVNGTLIGTLVGGSGQFQESFGAVCKKYTASSGCMTIRFTSNTASEFSGFVADWKCLPFACQPDLPLSINPNFSSDEAIEALTSTQAVVTFKNLDCGSGASGIFQNGDQTDLGLEKGVLLTTGLALIAQGPNVFGSDGESLGLPGDPDLDVLSGLFGNPIESFDACVLELEVFANTDELAFEYVFGSEEYPEFAGPNSNFNDIFAFLISGPGITGIPGLNGQDNMAILPNGDPVQINSVNQQVNWEFFRNNVGGQSVNYDGLTSDFLGTKKSLTARYTVEPCQTYKLKLAIADRGDGVYDSGVFISEIKGGTPTLAVNFNNGIDYLVEDCSDIPDELIIGLTRALPTATTFDVTVGGTATLGVDYTLDIPALITFQPGEQQLIFPITVLTDAVTEGDETITITLSNDFGCGNVVFAVFEIIIRDELKISVNGDVDTAFYCPGTTLVLGAEGAGNYFWEPAGSFSDPTGNPVQIEPTGNTVIYVTGNLGLCTAMDSIHLVEVNPQIAILNNNPVNICEGNVVTLVAQDNMAGQGNILWTPSFGLTNPTSATTNASPQFNTQYIVTANLTGCTVSDTIQINVDPFAFPNVIQNTSVCEGGSIQLANTTFSSTQYVWSPATFLDNPFISGPVASPLEETTYKLVATSASGFCVDSAEVTIGVIPAALAISNPPINYLCLGDTLLLGANFTPGANIVWTPSDSTQLIQTGDQALVFGTSSFWAFAEMTTGPCSLTDSVFVRVDSLPDLAISKILDNPVHCQGELITLYSPSYLNKDYPDISHQWIPTLGFITPDSNLNVVLNAQSTATYTRVTTNNACEQTDSINLIVIPAGLTLSTSQLTMCPGDTAQVFVLDTGIEDIQWAPPTGLSCTTCPDPIVTGIQSTVYTVTASEMGCSKAGNLVVDVVEVNLNLPEEVILCEGDSLTLNPNPISGVSYTWTSTDPGFNTTNETSPKVSPPEDATYFVVTMLGTCADSAQITIRLEKQPTVTVTASEDVICQGDEVVLTALCLPEGGTYLWDPTGESEASISVTPSTNPVYSVTYTSANNCFTATASETIEVNPIVDITLEFDEGQDSLLVGSNVKYTATTEPSPPPAGSQFVWRVNGQIVAGANTNTLETVAKEGAFLVEVSIITPAGCIGQDSISKTFMVPLSQVPNLFTPNGDNVNDFFNVILDLNLRVTGFKVYSRWGKLVYDNQTPDKGWDGTYEGEPAPADVYGYFITVERFDGTTETFRGDVTLVR